MRSALPVAGRFGLVASGVAGVEEGPTMFFDIKEFAYHYKCKHCGHEWTENREEDKPIEVDMDPIND